MEIVFLDKIEIPETDCSLYHQNQMFNILSMENTENIDASYYKNVNLIVSQYTGINKKMIENFPNLRYIVLASVTYRWVDLDYCKKRNITVSNCPTYNTGSTAQFAINLLFEMTNSLNIQRSRNGIKRGEWLFGGAEHISYMGKKVAVFGKGNVGSKIIAVTKALGMDVTVFDSKSTKEQIDELLPRFDYIFLAVPCNKNTTKLISKERIKKLKPESIIISISAGEVIDEDALIEALDNKAIGGACLDSFSGEPFRKRPSKNLAKLATLTNVIVTPHMAWNTHYSKKALPRELYKVVMSCVKGNPINVVS